MPEAEILISNVVPPRPATLPVHSTVVPSSVQLGAPAPFSMKCPLWGKSRGRPEDQPHKRGESRYNDCDTSHIYPPGSEGGREVDATADEAMNRLMRSPSCPPAGDTHRVAGSPHATTTTLSNAEGHFACEATAPGRYRRTSLPHVRQRALERSGGERFRLAVPALHPSTRGRRDPERQKPWDTASGSRYDRWRRRHSAGRHR
jgi:hypothetical protein